jgi:hypothetical protein
MKLSFVVFSVVSLITASWLWVFGVVSPNTGPYWYCPAVMAGVFAILYAGTKE